MTFETQFIVRCHACHFPFEAFDSNWCSCDPESFSIACPVCGMCLCTRPQLEGFWRNAPRRLRDARAAEQKRRASAGALDGRPRVLVIDDDPQTGFLTRSVVQTMGFRTVNVCTADQALLAVLRWRPRVVMSKATMSEIDSDELCRLVKAARDETRFVVLNSKENSVHNGGADEYLSKPLKLDHLKRVLDRLTMTA